MGLGVKIALNSILLFPKCLFLYFVLQTCLFQAFLIQAQPVLNETENYFVQKQKIQNYFDSMSSINDAQNLNKKIPGFGEFSRWMETWEKFMPKSGNFEEEHQILRQTFIKL